jgi:hypothetical protein
LAAILTLRFFAQFSNCSSHNPISLESASYPFTAPTFAKSLDCV